MKKSFIHHKKLFVIIGIFSLLFVYGITRTVTTLVNGDNDKQTFWEFRSIDTMKYSRDLSREKLNDPTFDLVIDQQVKQIAETGATHVAIATPYDEEFLPILERWVSAARKYNLNIWFRGNWSGWEEWFGYDQIDRPTHIAKTKEFIVNHPYLFENGDVFSACPECENGGPGDPRRTRDVDNYRKFLIDEYTTTKDAFDTIGKDVKSNYHSMNGDVARLIMDRETTKSLDGLVVIDHYVKTPEKLVKDIKILADQSGGKVVLGEFGAPIPDIHGKLTEEEQALWLREAFKQLIDTEALVGVNYWTGVGSSTALWSNDGKPRKALNELTKVYQPVIVEVTVKNEVGQYIQATLVSKEKKLYSTNGNFSLIHLHDNFPIRISAEGYQSKDTAVTGENMEIILKKEHEDILFKIHKFFKNLVS